MNTYVEVYTILFAVMFNVMVNRSQQFETFALKPRQGWEEFVCGILKFPSAILMIVLVPALFLVFALPVVANFPDKVDACHLLLVLYWVCPVYGFQQGWLLFAKPGKWVQTPEIVEGSETWWITVLMVFGIGPIFALACAYLCQKGP